MSYTLENQSHEVELNLTGRSSRRRADKGLPDDKALLDLARTYLEIQHRLWPMLVSCGLLPAIMDSEIEALAAGFRDQFLNNSSSRFLSDIDSPPWEEIGAAYLRYSCDNSNPRSLDQPLGNVLEGAARDKVFIPWLYIFADAAVTGTIATRRGYEMVKALIRDNPTRLRRVYIDEIGRASRDAIEALRLGRLIEHHRRRLIGISDGFDSDLSNSKFLISMYGMLHQWFVDQLRSKVNRGMSDAFRRGGNIRPPSIGYKLVAKSDANGAPVFKDNGKPVREKVIDEAQAKFVQEAFHNFAEMRWSPDRIARRFNELNVGGRNCWGSTNIRQLLTRTTYIGIEYEGKTTRMRDPETESEEVVNRAPQEWKRRDVPHLRITSDELWEKAQARRKECSRAFGNRKKESEPLPSRTTVYPTTLFRPVCGYCGTPLCLGRSGKYRTFVCLNGRDRKRECKLQTYKAVKLVETAILEHLKAAIFTPKYLEQVLMEANRFIMEQANRAPENTEPLRQEISRTKAKRDRLVQVLERDTEQELGSLVEKVRQHERRLKELRDQLDFAQARNVAPPPPMTIADINTMTTDLLGVLNQDVAISAPLLAKLTGPITIFQGEDCGRKGTAWIAKFKMNLAAGFVAMGCASTSSRYQSWEYLQAHSVLDGDWLEVVVEEIPKYEQFAAKVKDLRDQGTDLTKIAKMLMSPG